MSRKDYIETARIFRQTKNDYSQNPAALEAIDTVQSQIAGMFARTNPRFDRARFTAACDPATGKTR